MIRSILYITFYIIILSQNMSGQVLTLVSFESRCLNDGAVLGIYDNITEPVTFTIDGPNGTSSATVNINKHTFHALPPGLYYVTAVDANNITMDDSIFVTSTYQLPTLNSTITDQVTCPGGNDGSILAQGIQGRSPYYYSLYNGNNMIIPSNLISSNFNGTFDNLAEGDYTVVMVDSCSNQTVQVITMSSAYIQPTNYEYLEIVERISCDSVKVRIHIINDDTRNYEFSIAGSGVYVDTNVIVLPLMSDGRIYAFVFVRDEICPDASIFPLVISMSPLYFYNILSGTFGANCQGYYIGVNVHNLFNPVYSWTDPITGQVITSNNPVTIQAVYNQQYLITVTDDCGFNQYFSYNIGAFEHFNLLEISASPCTLGAAEVLLNFPGGHTGADPWTITFLQYPILFQGAIQYTNVNINANTIGNFDLNTVIPSSIIEGTYQVEFIDNCGKADTVDFVVTSSDLLWADLNSQQIASCGQTSNIKFIANANTFNAESFYLYEIGTNIFVGSTTTYSAGSGGISGYFYNIVPGNYFVEWRKCGFVDQIIRDTITVHPSQSLNLNVGAIQCPSSQDLTISLQGVGGVANYQYRILDGPILGLNVGKIYPTQWSNQNSFSGIFIPQSGDIPYTVQVKDTCNTVVTYEITGYQSLVGNIIISDVICDPTLELFFDITPAQLGVGHVWTFPDGSMTYNDTASYSPLLDTGTVFLTSSLYNCPDVISSYHWSQPCASLPVTWITFNARKIKKEIHLFWETGYELNNNHYNIQKSNNGSSWITLGQLPGNPPSYSAFTYTYIDTQPNLGINYYRIAQVDNDGTVNYSTIISEYYDANNNNWLLYPQPNSGNFKIKLPDAQIQDYIHLSIYDTSGKLIYSQTETIDINELHINMPAPIQGLYHISCTDSQGEIIYNDKLIIY